MSGPDDELDLTPHRLTPPRGTDPTPSQEITAIVGYVGAGRTDEYVRVYLTLAMTSYYEVEAADVVRTKQVDVDDPDSPRQLWIKADAQIRVVRVNQFVGPASFLKGGLRKKYAKRLGSDPYVLPATDGICPTDLPWVCDPTPLSVTEATTGTWPCSGTDVWPQCPDCCG